MGKKRNNAAKKKQAAKAKRLSSTYGVSVLKGGTQASRKNGALDATAGGGSHANHRKRNAQTLAPAAPEQNRGRGGNAPLSTPVPPGERPRDGESEEFERMHASLEERSLALQARNDERRRSKKQRQKRQKKGWGKFARPSTNFAPATLTLAPKTTQELVDDAAHDVARGMNEIGRRAMVPPTDGASAMPGQSSLAAAASLNWKMRVSNVANPPRQPQDQNNSFAALGDDSDSDNEWADKETKVVHQFQFKPASFSFQPTVSKPPAMGPAVDGDDIDPDL